MSEQARLPKPMASGLLAKGRFGKQDFVYNVADDVYLSAGEQLTYHYINEEEGKQSALVFTSGYVANQSSISTIARLIPDCLILSDELNHNSMIEGVNQSNRPKQVFRHNDLEHLKQLLTSAGESRPFCSRVYIQWTVTSLQ